MISFELNRAVTTANRSLGQRSGGLGWVNTPGIQRVGMPGRGARRKAIGRAFKSAGQRPPPAALDKPKAVTNRTLNQVPPASESQSVLALYMREVGTTALLTPEQESALAARMRCGDEAAREQMIRANLRLVIRIARDYEYLGLPLLDLINEGNIGLMKAVERFDPAKGGKLSTYASLWIRQQIRRALASQGKTIRLPVHVADRIYRLGRAEMKLATELGREPSDDELAAELGSKVSQIARLRRAAMRPASLDAPLGEEGNTVGEVIADENAGDPFIEFRDQTETRLIRQLVARLPEREGRILRFRFGLDDGCERTLEVVGAKFKLTRERIRQLQNLALAKLRRMLEEPGALPAAA